MASAVGAISRTPLNAESLHKLFDEVRRGKLSPDDAVARLRHLPFEDLGFAKHGGNVLATRADAKQYAAVKKLVRGAKYRELARAIVLQRDQKKYGKGVVTVVSAGTGDIPVAEEAVVTAELMGNDVQHLYDVGVAGVHRLLANREALAKARVLIVCAGMEGALPSVVGGLVGVPVIAVPTSVGYGASFKGLAALLGMMNSCASNVSVVNIDNGFGAGYVASLINRL